MPPRRGPHTLEERLNLHEFSKEECSAALRGERVPYALGLPVTRACIVSGIRYNNQFARELYKVLPIFTRALHARSIMSNIIPEIEEEEDFPYCIWYPELANEATYRALVIKYPQMCYQVGRACAVAGYIDLYHALDILPEVSIAEEARDNEKTFNATIIFKEIMASPVKYSVMNDYTRSVAQHDPKAGACLNADTAVRSSLNEKHEFIGPTSTKTDSHLQQPYRWRRGYFNLTEDFGVTDHYKSEEQVEETKSPPTDLRVQLLYTPLPSDLPNIDKDVLILRAAYSGNIERYVRLRRPEMIDGELACVIRGIYHDIMFAKWWTLQPEICDTARTGYSTASFLRRAINARFIMNNDLSRIKDSTPESDLPYLIYYPNWASVETYKELWRRKPSMKPQIARACIAINEEELYDELDVEPSPFLYNEAYSSPNPYFLENLKLKGPDTAEANDQESGKMETMPEMLENVNRRPLRKLGPTPVDYEQGGIYDGLRADFLGLENFICGFKPIE